MSTSDVIATIGVAMLLLAFLLNQRGREEQGDSGDHPFASHVSKVAPGGRRSPGLHTSGTVFRRREDKPGRSR